MKRKNYSFYTSSLLNIYKYCSNFDGDIIPFKITKILKDISLDEVKGLPVLATFKDGRFAKTKFVLKILPVEIDEEMNTSMVEYDTLKLLTNDLILTGKCIHFPMLYSFTQKTSMFNKDMFKGLHLEDIYDNLSVRRSCKLLFCEYITHKDIDSWVFHTKKKISLDIWRTVIFQVIFSLGILQEKYMLVHNDFHVGNVLIDEILPGGIFEYSFLGQKFTVPNTGVIVKLWDFEFTKTFNSDGIGHGLIRNPLEISGYSKFNPYSDIHFFFKELLSVENIPDEIHDFVTGLYPEELLNDTDCSKMSIINHSDLPETEFLKHGKLKEYAFDVYPDLPTPKSLLKHEFFTKYTYKTAENVEIIATFEFS